MKAEEIVHTWFVTKTMTFLKKIKFVHFLLF